MIAAAQVIFTNHQGDGCLEWLLEQLQMAGIPSTRTEWRGYTMVIPQILVALPLVAFTVQVDSDPDYVPGEIQELVGQVELTLPPEIRDELARCDTRLDVMSATVPGPQVTDTEIVVVAETDVDPTRTEVADVLSVLARLTSGFVVDCVNNRLRAPQGVDWVQL